MKSTKIDQKITRKWLKMLKNDPPKVKKIFLKLRPYRQYIIITGYFGVLFTCFVPLLNFFTLWVPAPPLFLGPGHG